MYIRGPQHQEVQYALHMCMASFSLREYSPQGFFHYLGKNLLNGFPSHKAGRTILKYNHHNLNPMLYERRYEDHMAHCQSSFEFLHRLSAYHKKDLKQNPESFHQQSMDTHEAYHLLAFYTSCNTKQSGRQKD